MWSTRYSRQTLTKPETFPTDSRKILKTANFMKIRPVTAELFHQTYMIKPKSLFTILGNATKHVMNVSDLFRLPLFELDQVAALVDAPYSLLHSVHAAEGEVAWGHVTTGLVHASSLIACSERADAISYVNYQKTIIRYIVTVTRLAPTQHTVFPT